MSDHPSSPPWDASQPLRADASDEQIGERIRYLIQNTPTITASTAYPVSDIVGPKVVREFAAACVAAKGHHWTCPSHQSNVACTCKTRAQTEVR